MRRSVLTAVLLLPAATVALAACARGAGTSGTERAPRVPLSIETSGGVVRLEVEVADEPDERARGLMGRTSLEDGTGMAFLFDEPTDGGFWMKDTPLPLSIAFWDEDGRIVDLFDMEPCEEDPCPAYYPSSSYVGALEVPRGFFERHGVGIGDVVGIER